PPPPPPAGGAPAAAAPAAPGAGSPPGAAARPPPPSRAGAHFTPFHSAVNVAGSTSWRPRPPPPPPARPPPAPPPPGPRPAPAAVLGWKLPFFRAQSLTGPPINSMALMPESTTYFKVASAL